MLVAILWAILLKWTPHTDRQTDRHTERQTDRLRPLTVDEEELQEVQDDEQRVEGVEVHVEGVAPLHVVVLAALLQQVPVGHAPAGHTVDTPMNRRPATFHKPQPKL